MEEYRPPQQDKKPIAGKIILFIIIGLLAAAIIAVFAVLVTRYIGPLNKDDPILGEWEAKTLWMDDNEYDAHKAFDILTLEFMRDGNFEILMDKETIRGTWSFKDGLVNMKCDDNNRLSGEYKENTILIEEFLDPRIKALFERTSLSDRDSSENKDEDRADEEDTKPKPPNKNLSGRDAWEGQWHGYFWILEGFGEWELFGDTVIDAYMDIDLDEDGKGSLEILLDESDRTPTVTASVELVGESLKLIEGKFWDMSLDPEVWNLILYKDSGFITFQVFDSYMEPNNPDRDTFDFSFFLRPLGSSWDDVIEMDEILPPAIEADLDKDYDKSHDSLIPPIGEDDLDDEDPRIAKAVFTYDELEAIYGYISIDEDYSYEEVRDLYFKGKKGALDEDNASFTSYIWRASDDDNMYLELMFLDKDGYDYRVLDSCSIIK